MALQSSVRFNGDSVHLIEIPRAVECVRYASELLLCRALQRFQTWIIRFGGAKVGYAQVHFAKALLPIGLWCLPLYVDSDALAFQFPCEGLAKRHNLYPEVLAVPKENIRYVGSYYHSNNSFSFFSALNAEPLNTSNPFASTYDA